MKALRSARRPLALAAMAALALGGCGSTKFTAEEMIAEINRHGGELALGQPLSTQSDEVELYSLTLTSSTQAPQDTHAAGTLLITGGDGEALAEYHRCESAASLVCFRAANAVLIFQGAVPQADLARLGRAIQGMASG